MLTSSWNILFPILILKKNTFSTAMNDLLKHIGYNDETVRIG